MTFLLVADTVRSSYVDGPGHRYALFLQGCTFNCRACHNPHTIARRSPDARWMTVDQLVADIAEVAPFLAGVTVSGGEATVQWEAVHELFEKLALEPATSRLTRLVDTNGDADPAVWSVLATSMHGAMVDLKALDPATHRVLTGRDNERVLATIRDLAARQRLTEVRLLVVPGVNDSADQVAATGRWLAAIDGPVVVSGFRHHGTRRRARAWAEATVEDLTRVADSLRAEGVRDVRRRSFPEVAVAV
ncbi:MAG: radical SAM protein [Acidimicrobiales bacterium]